MNKRIAGKIEYRPRVHKILAHSYMVYLAALFFGLIFSVIEPLKIYENNLFLFFGVVLLVFATVLIFWAQKSTRNFKKENVTKNSFKNGPYRYIRNPTNTGLFVSILSFGLIVNSVFVIFFVLIAFILSRFVFLKREESLLEKKYGVAYLEYKKDVRF